MINRVHPIFTGHFDVQNNVKIPARVRVFVCWHALVAQNDHHPGGGDLAFWTRYPHPSAVEVVDQYTVKAQKGLR